MASRKYTIHEDTVRPIRLWDPQRSAYIRGRQYIQETLGTHIGAYIEARRLIPARNSKPSDPVGAIEIIDCTTGKLLHVYTRMAHGVHATGGDALFKFVPKKD